MWDHGRSRRSTGSYVLTAAYPRRRCAGSSISGLVSARSCRKTKHRLASKGCARPVAMPGGSGRSQRSGASSLSELLPEGSRFAVLASGSGTNLQALLDAYPGNLVVVAGGKKEAFAFERARRAGVLVEHVDPAGVVGNVDYDRELAARIEVHGVELVVGAEYMQILSPVFLERFPAVLNVHPSLLPDFRGLHAVEQALETGVEETGVTVHFMVEEVDAGPIVAQQRVPVLPEDTKGTLLARLHPVEHRLLVRAVADYFLGRVEV